MTNFRVVLDQPEDQDEAIPGGPAFIVPASTPQELIRAVEEYVRRPRQAWAADLSVIVDPTEYTHKIRGAIYIGQSTANSFTAVPVVLSFDDTGRHRTA
jgi:hypothetical protein